MGVLDKLYVPSVEQAKCAVTYLPNFTRARVISVYDGDTLTIARKQTLWWKSKVASYKVRLNGIDCPELRGSSEEEKAYATKARDVVQKLVLNKTVKLDIQGYDKYGRLLACVYVNKTNISDHLLSIGLAVPYDGKTKSVVNWKETYATKNLISMIETVK